MNTTMLICAVLMVPILEIRAMAAGVPRSEPRLVGTTTLVANTSVTFLNARGLRSTAACVFDKAVFELGPDREEERRQGSVRSRIALSEAGPGGRMLWSYWPPNVPLAYDFTIGHSTNGSIIVFARNYSIGVFEKLERLEPVAFEIAGPAQPEPRYIDLAELVGAGEFAPDEGVIANALTRNLRIESVVHEGAWRIVVRGKGGRLFTIQRAGRDWVLEKPGVSNR